jgi:hypothetical protein
MTEYMRTGCATVVIEETPLIKANRVILRLLAAAYAVEGLIVEAMGNDAEKLGEVMLLRAAMVEAERYCEPSGEVVAERILSKIIS